jgi:hypothetical protein
MVQTLSATDSTLAQLSQNFGLEQSHDLQFFREWQDNLPELSEAEKQALDDVKRDYLHLAQYDILEPIVKLVILSPLLRLAGLYRPPFYLTAEEKVDLISEDEGTVVKGRIDILAFHPPFWVVCIEAKRLEYSSEAGIPQTLAYLLANPHPERSAFGFVTNGVDFVFLKLAHQHKPIYSRSYPFSIYRGDDLYTVLRILKHLSQLTIT